MTSIPYSGLEWRLKPHLYITKRGERESFSSDMPQNIGYYINAVSAPTGELGSRRFRCAYCSRK
jgi:hypothetical protein